MADLWLPAQQHSPGTSFTWVLELLGWQRHGAASTAEQAVIAQRVGGGLCRCLGGGALFRSMTCGMLRGSRGVSGWQGLMRCNQTHLWVTAG